MKFEWDENKSKANLDKHMISFNVAKYIYFHERFTLIDSRKDYGEKRFINIGSVLGVVLVVISTIRDDTIRIISARKANQRERSKYYEYIKKANK